MPIGLNLQCPECPEKDDRGGRQAATVGQSGHAALRAVSNLLPALNRSTFLRLPQPEVQGTEHNRPTKTVAKGLRQSDTQSLCHSSAFRDPAPDSGRETRLDQHEQQCHKLAWASPYPLPQQRAPGVGSTPTSASTLALRLGHGTATLSAPLGPAMWFCN